MVAIAERTHVNRDSHGGFDDWEWNEPGVHEILVFLTEEIKQVTLGMGFKLPKIYHLEKNEKWTLRTQGDKSKL